MVRRKSNVRRSKRSLDKNKSAECEVLVTRKKRAKPGAKALKEIKFLRKSTALLIPKLSFSRLVREIMNEIFPRSDISRMQQSALEALQEAAEMYLVQFFEDVLLLAIHCKRVTIMQKDMILMRRLRGRNDVINH
ncbi:hypothetical protein PV327_010513 [Microctonus hyperodae]|uniref:Core Histone H2A/H2B/H3 domain-containing protein n=1 Tax=Microctonus hyperodae TaxID=165561 RepID=A0AA39FSB9_MICHY|nr:hypothetical protein PV327_010513 [Microctonus hyperodae]